MRPSPFAVELPTGSTPGQIIAGTITMLRVFGWQLGERYEIAMTADLGSDWLEDLRRSRHAQFPDIPMYKKRLNLHDPQFGVNEPLRNEDSPLRKCLPPFTLEFFDKFKRIPALRNREQHFDEVPSLARLRQDAELIGWVAKQIGLPMSADCTLMVERVDHLSAGKPVEAEKQMLPELLAQIQEEREKAHDLAAEVAKLRQAQREEETTSAADTEALSALSGQLERAEAAKLLAEDKLAAAQAELELTASRQRRTASQVTGLSPGEPWPEPPPTRTLRLLPHVVDLYDPASMDLLSNEVGAVATAAATRWGSYLPHGGTVHLTEAGQGVALIGAQWTYLGQLDEA